MLLHSWLSLSYSGKRTAHLGQDVTACSQTQLLLHHQSVMCWTTISSVPTRAGVTKAFSTESIRVCPHLQTRSLQSDVGPSFWSVSAPPAPAALPHSHLCVTDKLRPDRGAGRGGGAGMTADEGSQFTAAF